jgi:hypothetical protein
MTRSNEPDWSRRQRLLFIITNLADLERRNPHIQPGVLVANLNPAPSPDTDIISRRLSGVAEIVLTAVIEVFRCKFLWA